MSDMAHTYIDIVACDLSFRRPGFALLRYYTRGKKVKVLRTSNINNKGQDKCDGEILSEIARELRTYLAEEPMAVIVRERALDVQRKSHTIEILHKVVGVSDLYAWALGGRVFEEIHPKTIKKLVANDQLAEKNVVAAALEQFVGKYEYACDDESDAVAVGIAWLIQNDKIPSPYAEEKKTLSANKTTKKKADGKV